MPNLGMKWQPRVGVRPVRVAGSPCVMLPALRRSLPAAAMDRSARPDQPGTHRTAPMQVAQNTEREARLRLRQRRANQPDDANAAAGPNENARISNMEEENTGGENCPPNCKVNRPDSGGGGGKPKPRPKPKPCVTVNMEEENTGCE